MPQMQYTSHHNLIPESRLVLSARRQTHIIGGVAMKLSPEERRAVIAEIMDGLRRLALVSREGSGHNPAVEQDYRPTTVPASESAPVPEAV